MKTTEFDQGDGEYSPISIAMGAVVCVKPVTVTTTGGNIQGSRIWLVNGPCHIVHKSYTEVMEIKAAEELMEIA